MHNIPSMIHNFSRIVFRVRFANDTRICKFQRCQTSVLFHSFFYSIPRRIISPPNITIGYTDSSPPRIPLATDSIASRNIRLRFIFKALADGSNCPCRLFGVGRRFYFEEFQNFGIRVFPDTEGKRARSCHGQCGRSVV